MRLKYGAGQSRPGRGDARNDGRKPAPRRCRRRRFAGRPMRRLGRRRRLRVPTFVRQAAASIAARRKRRGRAVRGVSPRTRARLRVAQRRAGPCRGRARLAGPAGADGRGSNLRPAPAAQSGGGRGADSYRPRAVAAAQQLFRQAPRLSHARHAPRRLADRLRPSRPSGAAPGAARPVRDGRNGSVVGAVAGDGCGVPVVAMRLVAIARAFALLAVPDDLPRARAAAARQVVAAMTANPYFVGGTDRFDTLVTESAAGGILIKGGAEGVCAAALPKRGLGFAVKIDDGAKRAAETAMAALLARYAGENGAVCQTLAAFQVKPVVDTRSLPVGSIRPAQGWLG